jgi:hypothetical protein
MIIGAANGVGPPGFLKEVRNNEKEEIMARTI